MNRCIDSVRILETPRARPAGGYTRNYREFTLKFVLTVHEMTVACNSTIGAVASEALSLIGVVVTPNIAGNRNGNDGTFPGC